MRSFPWLIFGSLSLCCATGTAEGEAATTKDAIVVLGHRPPTDEPRVEPEARLRVEQGVRLFKEGRAPLMVFTGGESVPHIIEADVMAQHAEGLGVPRAAILRERASHDTIENARFTVKLLRDRLHKQRPSVLLVTSDYHLRRATALFRCAGADVEGSSVSVSKSAYERRKQSTREFVVRMYYWLIDECARAAGDDE